MILFLLTKCISFENYKLCYWYFRDVSFYLKQMQIHTSICHCFVFYFTHISLSDRVLCLCPTTHVFALCRICPCLVLFHMLCILTYISNCKYWLLYGGVMTSSFYFYMYLVILTRLLFAFKGLYKVICRYLQAQTNTRNCANYTQYMYVSFISNLHLTNICKMMQAPVIYGILIVGKTILRN